MGDKQALFCVQCNPHNPLGRVYAHFVEVGTEAQRDEGGLLEGTYSWLVTEQSFKPNTSLMVHSLPTLLTGKEAEAPWNPGS